MMAPTCDLDALQRNVSAGWRSVDVARVNGNAVRFRVMEDRAADWHVHPDSDELLYVVSGTVEMDTEYGAHTIAAGQLLVVPAGTRHRARVSGRATVLVIDAIGSPDGPTGAST